MKAIVNRLRRLEIATAPNERACAAAEAIRTARRKRLGADYQEIVYPPGSYEGCPTSADFARIRNGRERIAVHDPARRNYAVITQAAQSTNGQANQLKEGFWLPEYDIARNGNTPAPLVSP